MPSPRLLLSALTGLAIAASAIAHAGEATGPASAGLATPVDVQAEGDLTFGVVAVPREAACAYTVTPRGNVQATSRDECRFLSGKPLNAAFSVACSAGQMVTFEAVFTNTAPAGATFEAGDDPMEIDGLGEGAAVQVQACDKDGLSEVRIGGRLTVTPDAPSSFTGEVGSIRLEAAY